ncbi:DUF4440 domain-containing protein [Pedobacter sp. HMF7647]|uniref:DUF4440 domain-containing protein n=1 Tax=Hufsiella arboris TaxID=2695275 RepID=A0A7K1Y6D8_9SPHI|nr:nuclear transport factor 2 family protein [Hufsiella arboris]MXV50135.1 DUF4440 domain-containing protein [Hufsiella arboris]
MKLIRYLFIVLFSSLSFVCVGQQGEEQDVGKTIDRFLSYLSFADTASWQIDRLSDVFTEDGKLVANFGRKPLVFTVSQYIESVRRNVKSGQVQTSAETELARKTDVFGKIAQVLSTYELTITGKDGKVVRRGINAIQLIKQDGKWLIASLIWDRENDTLKLPQKYLRGAD